VSYAHFIWASYTNWYRQRIEGPTIFDYDPLTLDFPALCLHCLSPPPTLYQSTPMPNSESWSILPPDDQQYQALRAHFSSKFHSWRVSCAIANTIQQDDLSYPPPPQLFAGLDDPAEIAQRAESAATELESRISEHLHSAFAHWNGLSPQKRQEIWMLEFARNVGKKSEEISKLKKEKEFSLQEMSHLKQQVDELSRLQHPREFRLVSPTTIGLNREIMTELGELGMRNRGVGFDLMDRHVHLDTAIERAVGRWKTVVKDARGGVNSGMASQRSLSGESAPPTSVSAPPSTSQQVQPPPTTQNHQGHNLQHIAPAPPSQNHSTQNQSQNHTQSQSQNQHSQPQPKQNQNQQQNHQPPPLQTNLDSQSDADADADADMEDDDSFVEMDTPAAKYRLTNGQGMEGLEHERGVQVQNGYVRIGA
jgi:hypothetical protein